MPFLALSFWLAMFAAWFTHVIVCIQNAAWILLLFGIFIPPIGWVHGVGNWFGLF